VKTMTDAKDKTEAGPSPDTTPEMPAAPASLGGMALADLDWIENWLIQKRGTEHAARPYGKGSLLITTLIFEVRRERRHRDKVRGPAAGIDRMDAEARRNALAGHENHPGYGHALYGGTGERQGKYDFSGPFEDAQAGVFPDLRVFNHEGTRVDVPVGGGRHRHTRWPWFLKDTVLPLALAFGVTAAVVAGLMWWHTGGVLPQ
jgi:hypothetical protein